jgi:hypothetical protein
MARLPKKPKAPKRTASLMVWERFKQRVDEWKKKCNSIEAAKKRKAALINQLSKY